MPFERLLQRIVWALHRTGMMRATEVTMSSRAGACWQAGLREAGSPDSMNGPGLLRHLLADSESGLARLLVAEGADVAALRARLASVVAPPESAREFFALVRRSYEVVPAEVVAGLPHRRQVLHTAHFLWGFAADRSGAGAMIVEACPSVAHLRKDSDLWVRWQDS